ncbi:MAG: hypothetical protein ACOYXB_11785 [Bacteroidota bacterium]
MITELKPRPELHANAKLQALYLQLDSIVRELNKRDLPEEMQGYISSELEEINSIIDNEQVLKKLIRKKQGEILARLEKDLKLVTKNHYRNTWLALGIAVFGVPLGVVFGTAMGNMAFLGIGLPIGLPIGLAIGTGMDKKAADEGRQLDVEIRF